MTSQPNQLIIAGSLDDRIRAASQRRLIGQLQRDSRPAVQSIAARRRRFPRRGIASTPSP